MYLLGGCDAGRVETLRERLDQLGESVAIAASADGAGHYSVHVHADDAGAARCVARFNAFYSGELWLATWKAATWVG